MKTHRTLVTVMVTLIAGQGRGSTAAAPARKRPAGPQEPRPAVLAVVTGVPLGPPEES